MRSTHFLGLFVLGTVAAVAVGCGDDTSGTGGAGGGTTSTTTTTTAGVTTGTGGSTGDGNDDFDSAEEIEIDAAMGTFGALDPIDTDVDFYKFNGQAGQAIMILTDAKPDTNEFDTTYPDLVVTLYNAEQQQIAQNDDPFPHPADTNDSQLLTVLQTTGVYYLKVSECGIEFGANNCAPSDAIVNFDYGLAVVSLDPANNGIVQDTEPNDTIAEATVLEYEPNGNNYYVTQTFGDFSSAADVDVYSFTLPATPAVDNQMTGNFRAPYPMGPDGTGSTTDVSELAIFDAADLTKAIAKVDPTKGGDIGAPLMPGVEYFLFVTHSDGQTGPGAFYFMDHFRAGSNPPEAEELTNDVAATAEALVATPNGAGGESYFVDGLMPDGALPDVDHYLVPIPAGADATWTVNVACGAQRSGSGLRGFQFEVLNGDGSSINAAMYSKTETETEDATLLDLAIPANPVNNNLIVKLSSGTPAADVTSRYYRCGIHYVPPQN